VEISNYYYGKGSDLFAWEWGDVHFIWLGLWAFYGGYNGTNRSDVDWDKVRWLEDHLKTVGTLCANKSETNCTVKFSV